jgi:hypothetical protein
MQDMAKDTETEPATGGATPLEALRQACVECCNGSYAEVRACAATACPLWLFRLGRNPTAAERPASVEQAIYPLERKLTGATGLKAIRRRCLDCWWLGCRCALMRLPRLQPASVQVWQEPKHRSFARAERGRCQAPSPAEGVHFAEMARWEPRPFGQEGFGGETAPRTIAGLKWPFPAASGRLSSVSVFVASSVRMQVVMFAASWVTEIRSACAWVWVGAVASGEVIDQRIWQALD